MCVEIHTKFTQNWGYFMWIYRFDYSGHGASEGVFSEGTIGTWKKDVLFMLDELAEGPQVGLERLYNAFMVTSRQHRHW